MPRGDHSEVQTAFRLPQTLRDRLRARAKAEHRTMTAIVELALEAYLKQADGRANE